MKILHCTRWRFYKGIVLGLVVKNLSEVATDLSFRSLKEESEKPSPGFSFSSNNFC